MNSESKNQGTRVAILAIVIENPDSVEKLNAILHEGSKYIIGRMGVPYEKKKISLMSIMMDGPADVISSMSGKIGQLQGVTAKAVYSKLQM